MALRDPVSVHTAATNMDAHMVSNALIASNIETHVTEDLSRAGTWVGGEIAELHRPQVWVDRSEMERALAVIEEYEQRASELRTRRAEESTDGEQIEVVCEECGGAATFPATQRGSVQQCPHCDAYVDVEDPDHD